MGKGDDDNRSPDFKKRRMNWPFEDKFEKRMREKEEREAFEKKLRDIDEFEKKSRNSNLEVGGTE